MFVKSSIRRCSSSTNHHQSVAPGLRWLEAALSQSPVAARRGPKLHPGLHKLDVASEWLRVEEDRYAVDMQLKEAAFATDPEVLVAGAHPEAERETWTLVSRFLTSRHPTLFEFETDGSVAVRVPGYQRLVRPDENYLEAAARLAQEDLFLLERDADAVRLVASSCCFSFGAAGTRTRERQSLDQLHAKVGGYPKDLGRAVNRLILNLDAPVWRTNWSISLANDLRPRPDRDFMNPEKQHRVFGLDAPSDPADDALRKFEALGVGSACFCKSEYQTLRRLRAGPVLFTVHTYVERFDTLPPKAAANLAENITLAAQHDIRHYKNLSDPRVTDQLLAYLHDRALLSSA